MSDPKVYAVFAAGQTKGVFQFESGGMRDVVMKMRPNRIEDLIAANALYRPGPMVNIDAYIARKHGERWSSTHKIMDEVLAETYGIIVYQEQVARLVNQLGGIERKRAFRLAKAISKKKTSMIEAEREPFVEGAVRNGLKKDAAEAIFNQILPFGEYAFNKAFDRLRADRVSNGPCESVLPAGVHGRAAHHEMGDTDKVSNTSKNVGDWGSTFARRTSIPARRTSRPSETANKDSCVSAWPRSRVSAKKRCRRSSKNGIAAGRSRACSIFASGSTRRTLIGACSMRSSRPGPSIRRGRCEKPRGRLDRAMQVGVQTQRDRLSGQLNMFGAFDAGPAQPQTLALSTAEWSEAEMLAHEKVRAGLLCHQTPAFES